MLSGCIPKVETVTHLVSTSVYSEPSPLLGVAPASQNLSPKDRRGCFTCTQTSGQKHPACWCLSHTCASLLVTAWPGAAHCVI